MKRFLVLLATLIVLAAGAMAQNTTDRSNPAPQTRHASARRHARLERVRRRHHKRRVRRHRRRHKQAA
jgi:Ni/Co efflux regulator RcnB